MSLDLTQHVDWSTDDDYYYASVQLRTPDGQLGTVEVKVDRSWVIQTAQAVRKRLLETAPAGVDVGAWRNQSDPQRFVKLCQYVAGEEVKRQLTEQVKRDGIVVAPWFGEWTMATADAAYRLIRAAQSGDETSIQQLERLREHAEAGDPAAVKALAMINSVAKLVARNLPPPSVVATRVEGGALPRAQVTTSSRRVIRKAPRALPPRRGGGTVPRGGPRRGAPTRSASAPSAVASPRGAAVTMTMSPSKPAASMSAMAAPRTSLSALRPVVTTLVPQSPVQPTPPLYNPFAQYPYGMMPIMDPGDFGGGGGGGYGGDLGPDDFLASEEDNGAGGSFDEDDGTYYEDEGMTESDFPADAPQYAIGEFPEELAQSVSEEDDSGVPDESGALPGEDGGAFPGEGSVGG